MDENYTKRELDTYFQEVKGRFDSQDEKLKEITRIAMATDTKVGIQNGRVTKTEGILRGSMMAGAVALFLVGIIMSLIVYSFKISLDNQQATILLSVEQMIKK